MSKLWRSGQNWAIEKVGDVHARDEAMSETRAEGADGCLAHFCFSAYTWDLQESPQNQTIRVLCSINRSLDVGN